MAVQQPPFPAGGTGPAAPYKTVTVSEVVDGIARCRDRLGNEHKIPVSATRGRTPRQGDTWIIDRQYTDWAFGICLTPEPEEEPPPPSGARGAGMWRSLTSPMAGASGSRTVTYDSLLRIDEGFGVNTGGGIIEVQEEGWYGLEAHVRIASEAADYHVLSIQRSGTSIVRGPQVSAVTLEVSCVGFYPLNAGDLISVSYYSASVTQIVGGGAGANVYFRAVRL